MKVFCILLYLFNFQVLLAEEVTLKACLYSESAKAQNGQTEKEKLINKNKIIQLIKIVLEFRQLESNRLEVFEGANDNVNTIINKPSSILIKQLAKKHQISSEKILELVNRNIHWYCSKDTVNNVYDGYEELERWLINYSSAQHMKKLGEKKGVNIRRPFREFNPKLNWRKYGHPYKNCMDPNRGNFPIKIIKQPRIKNLIENISRSKEKIPKKFSLINPDCIPDILFSWVNKGLLSYLSDNYNNNSPNWDSLLKSQILTHDNKTIDTNTIFTSMSPLAGFAYGNHLVRIKVKPGVRYIKIDDPINSVKACVYLSDYQKRNTIIIRHTIRENQTEQNHYNHYLELNICSMAVVQSWSSGTKENYDEMVREYLWVNENSNREGTHFLYKHIERKPILYLGLFDFKNFTPSILRRKFQIVLERILRGEKGAIYFNPILSPEEKTINNHMISKNKIYWNAY